MIRRRDQHQPVGVAIFEPERRGQHGGGGVAPLGFDQDRAGIDPRLGQLFGHDEAEVRVGQHQRRGKAFARKPFGRGLEQGGFSHQRHELLGIGFARQRPEPCPRATTEKNGRDHLVCLLPQGRQHWLYFAIRIHKLGEQGQRSEMASTKDFSERCVKTAVTTKAR